jgi:hypothetical protein
MSVPTRKGVQGERGGVISWVRESKNCGSTMTRISSWGHKIYASICDVSPLSLSSAVISLVMFTYIHISVTILRSLCCYLFVS